LDLDVDVLLAGEPRRFSRMFSGVTAVSDLSLHRLFETIEVFGLLAAFSIGAAAFEVGIVRYWKAIRRAIFQFG
jgi:hypothetical protein